MKRLAVAIPYGLAFRNLACCGVLERLAAKYKLTVLLPPAAAGDRQVIAAELPSQVTVEELKVGADPATYRLLKFLKQHYFGERTALESFSIKKKFRRQTSPVWHMAASSVEWTASTFISEERLDSLLAGWPYPFERHYIEQFRQWRIDGVVVTKPGYHPDELALLKAARVLSLPTIAVDTTWDNMVSKRPPYVSPDAVNVWNAEMVTHSTEYYRFRSEAVHLTGGVQFDTFFRQQEVDRTQLLRSMGFDPDRPLIIFALSNPDFTAGTPEFARGLIERVANGKIGRRPNVLIRTHPWDPCRNDYAAGTSYASLRVEHPYRLPGPGTKFECLATRRDVERQGQLYRSADVIINIAGTTSLDGIAVDVPVVNIAFDAVSPAHPDASVTRFSSYSHYLPILKSGAVRLARSWDELVDQTNAALNDPATDQNERRAARNRFFGFVDDRAVDRVSAAIGAFV